MSGQSMADVLGEHEMENSPVIRGEGYTRCSCGFLSKGAYSRAAHNRHVEDALSAAGFGPVQESADLIRDLTDPEPCSFDHHGGCQAHGYLSLEPGDTCPQHDAKQWALNHAKEDQT